MASRAKRVAVAVMMAGASVWYLWQRITAGNAYAQASHPAGTDQNYSGLGVSLDWAISDTLGLEWTDWADSSGTGTMQLRYFSQDEFGEWWPYMSTELLSRLDEFRSRLGVSVMISPAEGAIGRHGGLSTSQHNVDMWGEVRAVDVMPKGVTLAHAYEVAKAVGFTGIGLYPQTSPYPMLHLDVRPGFLSTWSGFRSGNGWDYRGVGEALAA